MAKKSAVYGEQMSRYSEGVTLANIDIDAQNKKGQKVIESLEQQSNYMRRKNQAEFYFFSSKQ